LEIVTADFHFRRDGVSSWLLKKYFCRPAANLSGYKPHRLGGSYGTTEGRALPECVPAIEFSAACQGAAKVQRPGRSQLAHRTNLFPLLCGASAPVNVTLLF
jgi:hypothetical protein